MSARLHSFLGVVLSAYLLLHAYQNWPAIYDREAWLDRAAHGPSRGVALGLVSVLLLAHAVLGAQRFARRLRGVPASEVDANARGLSALQALTGVLALVFIGYHVISLRALDLGPHADQRAVYAFLWRNLGRPSELAIYAVGTALVCFHAAHGLSRIALGAGFGRGERGLLRARVLAGAFGFLIFALFVQLLGHFALGARALG